MKRVVFSALAILWYITPALAHCPVDTLIVRYPAHTEAQYKKTFVDHREGDGWWIELRAVNNTKLTRGVYTGLFSCSLSGVLLPREVRSKWCFLKEYQEEGTYTAIQYRAGTG